MVAKVISVAADHAGLPLKQVLVTHLKSLGWEVRDLGAHTSESVDYPDYGYKLADDIASGKSERGLVICGSGVGISIAANRHPEVRCALCSEPLSARLARQHNDANVLAMGSRLVGDVMATEVLDVFLATEFEGGRHQRRVNKLGEPIIGSND